MLTLLDNNAISSQQYKFPYIVQVRMQQMSIHVHLYWSVGTPQKRGLLRKFAYIIKKMDFFFTMFFFVFKMCFLSLFWTSGYQIKRFWRKKSIFFTIYLTSHFWVACQPTIYLSGKVPTFGIHEHYLTSLSRAGGLQTPAFCHRYSQTTTSFS